MKDRFAKDREKLAHRLIDDDFHYRILVVGRFTNGTTDIVACLIRALRNLGHHLLFFDTKHHRDLLDNPHGAKGGFGPIYVKGDYLRSAVKRFRPQVVLLMANGMTFSDQDIEWLKKEGVVVTGITLSDPDVLESVAQFAGTFDFHTTNAERALGMYKERGVNNTLYFPFGIDRGFVAQRVPQNDEFQADVICLGHATARPERNAVMKSINSRIGDRFKVRTYGRGWQLPDSRIVEGIEVLEASRAGRVHINFPATRAGYTNVKCGVFETVAGGSLLVTQRFDEMTHFFDYDSQIGGYNSYEELPELLDTLLRDAGRIEAMAEQGFKRLINEHLYEHRWKKLFQQMRTIDASAWLGEARAGEVREILSHSLPRCRNVIISGFYGARNLGDDLILSSIADVIETQVPGGRVTVSAQNAAMVERKQGYESFNRTDTIEANYRLTTADAVVLGGGGLWHDYTFERAGGLPGLFHGSTISVTGFGMLPLLATFREIPFHVVGMGAGPLSDTDAQVMVGHLARSAKSVTVRDHESKALLDEILERDDVVIQAPDVVYGVDLSRFRAEPVERPEDVLTIGVNLRPWVRGEETEETIVERVAAALRPIVEEAKKPVQIVLLPMQEGPTFDRAPLARLRTRLGKGVTFKQMSDPLSVEEYLSHLQRLDLLIAMRLHACLLAHRVGTRAIGLSYDPKVALHFGEVQRSDYALPLDFQAEGLTSVIRRALATPLDDAFFTRLRTLESAASDRLAEVAAMIAKTQPRDLPWMVPKTYELPDARDDGDTPLALQRYRAQLHNARGRLIAYEDQARRSYRWRARQRLYNIWRKYPYFGQILPESVKKSLRKFISWLK